MGLFHHKIKLVNVNNDRGFLITFQQRDVNAFNKYRFI